jgi:hypothetical protein
MTHFNLGRLLFGATGDGATAFFQKSRRPQISRVLFGGRISVDPPADNPSNYRVLLSTARRIDGILVKNKNYITAS